jgi:hypothetical protein
MPFTPATPKALWGCPHRFTRLPGNGVSRPQLTLAKAEPGAYTDETVDSEPIAVQDFSAGSVKITGLDQPLVKT